MEDLKMQPTNASVLVRMEVEVKTDAWGPECTLDQVVRQATKSASMKLRSLLQKDGNVRVTRATALRVVCNAKEDGR